MANQDKYPESRFNSTLGHSGQHDNTTRGYYLCTLRLKAVSN